MSLTKERIDINIEKILFNNKPASLAGNVIVKDLSKSKQGWIIVDCSEDNKISKGMNNVANKLNVKLNINNFYCKYEDKDENMFLTKNFKYNIVAEIFLSKGTTLYGKINTLNPIELDSSSHLDDSIKITNKEIKNTSSQKLSSNINLSDESINKIKQIMMESFSEVLNESLKNISNLVEVIKELANVIDKKGQSFIDNKDTHFEEDIPFNEELPNDDDDIPFNKEDLFNENENDIPFDDNFFNENDDNDKKEIKVEESIIQTKDDIKKE